MKLSFLLSLSLLLNTLLISPPAPWRIEQKLDPSSPLYWATLSVTRTLSGSRTFAFFTDHVCDTSAEFTTAIAAAVGGDTITLDNTVIFTGPFTLPVHSGSTDVDIRSSALASLPAGRRVSPSDAANMPNVVTATNSTSAILTAAGNGPAHWNLLGLEITTSTGSISTNDLIQIGDGSSTQNTFAEVPDDINFDRCYVHAATTSQELKRGISLQSSNSTIKNSYVSDFKHTGADSQAVGSWNGPGPYVLDNNYFEAAGECVLFGGAASSLPSPYWIPTDITVTRNYFSKPLTWKSDDPSYAGIAWIIKNLLEFKSGQNVFINGNVFEHNWTSAQPGFAVLFTVGVDSGAQAQIADVTFTNNLVRNVAGGINMRSKDDADSLTQRVTVQNNVFYNINSTWSSSNKYWLQILNGCIDITVNHNTALQDAQVMQFDGLIGSGLTFTNNVTKFNSLGVFGTGSSSGNDSLSDYWSSYTFNKNVLQSVDDYTSTYPANTYFPVTIAAIQFEDVTNSDYRLAAGSPYKNLGTDGADLGVNMTPLVSAIGASSLDLNTATISAVTGIWNTGSVSVTGKVTVNGKVTIR